MNQSESITALAGALVSVQGKLKPAPKDSENPFFKSKYADLSTIITHAAPVLTENGLSISQICEGDNSVTTILLHKSGEWISGTLNAKPVKDDPQSRGSAITYARRYSYASIIGLATEDDDGNAATHPDTIPEKKYAPHDKLVDAAIAKIDAAMFPKDCDEVITKALGYLDAKKLKDADVTFITQEANKKKTLLEEKQNG